MTEKQRSAFWAKVGKSKSNDGCWLWKGALNHGGYGVFGTKASPVLGGQVRAHRAAYELRVGRIPQGQLVLHRCDIRNCVNPGHLFLGSHADNMRDMSRKQRRAGERNPKAKLTEEDVLVIRKLRGVETCATLAVRYKVSPGTISSVWARHTWSHI